MALEKKIYSAWAFSEQAEEQSQINKKIYQDLLRKYNIISLPPTIYVSKGKIKTDYKEYDIVIQGGSGYGYLVNYRVLKNTPNLSLEELALLCDSGDLSLGFEGEGTSIKIRID